MEVTVHNKCPLIRSVIRDFFQHRAGFRLGFCKAECEHETAIADTKQRHCISLYMRLDTDNFVSNDVPLKTVSVLLLHSDSFSPSVIRSWLLKSISGSEIENFNRGFILTLNANVMDNSS